jgi:hypothetical protein
MAGLTWSIQETTIPLDQLPQQPVSLTLSVDPDDTSLVDMIFMFKDGSGEKLVYNRNGSPTTGVGIAIPAPGAAMAAEPAAAGGAGHPMAEQPAPKAKK